MQRRPLTVAASAAMAAAVVLPASVARGVNRTWTGGPTGFNVSWNDPGNWSPEGVPGFDDTVMVPGVHSFGNTNVTYDYPGSVALGILTLNCNNFPGDISTSVLSMSANTLTSTFEFLGDSSLGGSRGRGRINQSGGTNTVSVLTLGKLALNVGTYNLSGGTLNTNAGQVIVGDAGSGTFTQTGGSHNAGPVILGNAAGGSGTYNFSGGSFTPDELTVGNSGTGTLNVTNGVTVSSNIIEIAGNAGSSGAVNADGLNSQLFASTSLFVGAGGSGTLDLTGGARAFASSGAFIGAAGRVRVDGLFSGLWATKQFQVHAGGTLEVTGGGVIQGVTSDESLEEFNIDGTATVDGTGSRLECGRSLVVRGSLTVTGGGRVWSGFSPYANHLALILGPGASATINGAGSEWIHSGLLEVANDAALNVTAGGRVSSPVFFIGAGTVTIDGAGSTLTTSQLQVDTGFSTGSGQLNISNGSQVNVAGAVLMSGNGGTSTINLTSGGMLTVGGNITDGGSPSTGLRTITLDGGTLDMTGGSIGGAVPIDVLNFRSGTLKNVAQINNGAGLTKTTAGALTLDGTNTYTGVTTVSAGTLVFKTNYTTGSGIDIANDATAQLASSLATPANVVLKTASVNTHTSGKLDLRDNKLIVNNASAGSWNGSAYTGIAGLVDSGRGNAPNALWNGSGIVTSDTRAINNGDLVSIGVAKVSDVRTITDMQTTTFAGQTVVGADVLAMVTWGGDANLDGKINIDDYGRIDGNVGQSGSVFGWSKGDFNYDGKINIDDYGIIDGNINRQGTSFVTTVGGDGAVAVPEPVGLGLLALAGVLVGWRGRRRRGDHFGRL
jgi:autotransporter-associated beta strand protein/T5SS/PEP-CTERM-associated repeat protein